MQHTRLSVILFSLLCTVPSFVFSEIVTISNNLPRRDINGDIMDIHDGDAFYDVNYKLYFYYGASYGSCKEPAGSNGCADVKTGSCGFQLNHNVSLFTSPDLAIWTPHPHVFQMQDFPKQGILFCPKVIFNPKTKMYVLWFNWIDAAAGFDASYYAAAVSTTPYGPFKISNQNIQMGSQDTGDFDLFLDDDGSAYVIYTSHIVNYPVTHQMSVELLAPDFLSSMGITKNSGFFGSSFVEAPAMFSKNGTYYALFGSCCCYCGAGSPVVVHTASNPLGPWKTANSLGGNIPAQQTSVIRYQSTGGYAYLWDGDRWQSSPDGQKGHDFSYWGALNFDNQGNIQPLSFLNNYTISVVV